MKTYLAFIIDGYDDVTGEGTKVNLCRVTLVGSSNDTEEVMIEQAKLLVKRKLFICVQIIENFYPQK